MARYQRRYQRRPRRFRKARKVAGSTRSIAVRALKTARYVRKVAKPEALYLPFGVSWTPGTTAQVYPLNALLQGDANGTREGDNIRCVSFIYNLIVRKNASASYDHVRLLVVQEKQPIVVGTAPAIATMLVSDALSLRNPMTGSRYRFLMDRIVNLDSAGRSIITIRGSMKLGFVTKFQDNADDNNIERNALWLVALGVDNTNKSTIVLQGRLTYTDV